MIDSHDSAAASGPAARRPRAALVLLAVLLLTAIGVAWFVYRGLFLPVDCGGDGIEFYVRPGQSVRSVATELQRRGVIRSARLFELYARLTGNTGRVQSGHYEVSTAQSARSVLADFASGAVIDRSMVVTFPEGWRLEQFAARLSARGVAEELAFLQDAVMQPAYQDLYVLSGLEQGADLQGYLFPDTYRFDPGSDPRAVVRRMVNRLAQNLPADWESQLRQQGRTLHEALTLASIVEAEALDDDIADVAGVFWNRLRSGRRLESDATVNYALGTSKRQPTFADTYVEHPYNTYRFVGLPPGPIGSPGREAIAASIDPPEIPHFFFLHKRDGQIVLSRTFSEHLAAKARYLD